MPFRTAQIDPDSRFASNISFPMRWLEDGDILQSADEEVIDQSVQLIIMTIAKQFFLNPDHGSLVQTLVFDPLDPIQRLQLDTAVRRAIEQSEQRVSYVSDLRIDDTPDDSKRIVAVTYVIRLTGRPQTTVAEIQNSPVT